MLGVSNYQGRHNFVKEECLNSAMNYYGVIQSSISEHLVAVNSLSDQVYERIIKAVILISSRLREGGTLFGAAMVAALLIASI